MAEAQYSCVMQGSERQLILAGSGPQGVPTRWQFRRFQNRVIREGDQFSILIEVNGPGGFYTETRKGLLDGQSLPRSLQDAFGTAVEAQALSQKLMKPGVNPKDLWDANNAFPRETGTATGRRGSTPTARGTTWWRGPRSDDDEPMKIQAGMNVTIHPFAISKDVWAPGDRQRPGYGERGLCRISHLPQRSRCYLGLFEK